MIFIVVFFYMYGLVILEEKIKIRKNIRIIFSLLPLVLMIFFIKNIADYEAYKKFYMNPILENHFEVGYKYISNFFHNRGFEYHTYRIFLLLSMLSIFSIEIIKMKEICFTYFVFYIYTFIILLLIQYRSGISFLLLLIAVKFLKRNKILIFLFIMYIASKFHVSIIAFVPVILLKKVKNIKIRFVMGAFLFLFPFFLSTLYPILEKLLIELKVYFPALWKFEYYITTVDFKLKYGIKDIINIFLFFILSIKGKYLTKEERKECDIYIWIFYLGLFYRVLFLGYVELGVRMMILGQGTLFLLTRPIMRKYRIIKFLFCTLSFFILISWLTSYIGIL